VVKVISRKLQKVNNVKKEGTAYGAS